MAYQDKIGVAKLSEDEKGERFHIVFVDGEKLSQRRGYIMNTTREMSEEEVRKFFEEGGQPISDVEAMLDLARQTWKA